MASFRPARVTQGDPASEKISVSPVGALFDVSDRASCFLSRPIWTLILLPGSTFRVLELQGLQPQPALFPFFLPCTLLTIGCYF
jgi:hypothetical protein